MNPLINYSLLLRVIVAIVSSRKLGQPDFQLYILSFHFGEIMCVLFFGGFFLQVFSHNSHRGSKLLWNRGLSHDLISQWIRQAFTLLLLGVGSWHTFTKKK